MTNKEIVDKYIHNGLIQTCVDCQFAKLPDDAELKGDFTNDLVLILYSYDNAKLTDADNNNHFNALVTKIIVNQTYSHTSAYYKTYKKFRDRSDEITQTIEDTLADE